MLPPHRLLSLGEYAFVRDKEDKALEDWEEMIDDLDRVYSTWLLDPHGTARGTVGETPPPLWWDEDEAGAEALALTARMGAGSRG